MEAYKKIKGFKSACVALKRQPHLPIVSKLPAKHQQHVISNYIIITVIEAIHIMPDGKIWEPNWSDGSYKYQIWFYPKADSKRAGGFGFSYSLFGVWHSFTVVGSRLCFQSREKAAHALKILKKHYPHQILIIKPTKKLITT